MRITDLRIHSIAMADPPLRSSYGLHQPYALRNVIELESEDGIVGIAETYGGEQPATALESLRERMIGTDAWRLLGDLLHLVEGGASGMERSQTHHVPGENPLDADARTYSAIETAVLDLIGKALDVPVCDLIGGRVRDGVSFSAYPFYKHGGGGGEGGYPGGHVIIDAKSVQAAHLFGDGAIDGGIARMHPRHVLAIFVGGGHMVDNPVQMQGRGVDHLHPIRCRGDHFGGHQGAGVKTDRAGLDQVQGAHRDQVRRPRPGADEMNGHCFLSP